MSLQLNTQCQYPNVPPLTLSVQYFIYARTRKNECAPERLGTYGDLILDHRKLECIKDNNISTTSHRLLCSTQIEACN